VIGLALIAFAARVYLLRSHMYSYTASMGVYFAHLGSAQIFQQVAQLGTWSLIMISIERFWHPLDRRRRVLFWAILSSESFWGLISGMKGALLENFILVAVVLTLIRRRVATKWIVTAILGAVVAYPLFNNYRNEIRGKGMEVTSLASAGSAWENALAETTHTGSGTTGYFRNGVTLTLRRTDELTSLAWVYSIRPGILWMQTKQYWWLLPVYPFIPRVLWPSKPIDDMGRQFTRVLTGREKYGGTAVTYPGDLYLEYGLPGIVAGMFILGLVSQWFTGLIREPIEKRGLFIYVCLFPSMMTIEPDVFGFWVVVIKWFVILSILAWLIYGRQNVGHGRLIGPTS